MRNIIMLLIALAILFVFPYSLTADPYSEPINPFEEVSAMSFDSLNVRFIGNWPFGYSKAVAFDSVRSIVFCGTGGGVFISELPESLNPILCSEIRTRGYVRGLCYDNYSQKLYVATKGAGLEIWDISNQADPAKLGSYEHDGTICEVLVSDSLAYIADGDYGLRILNVAQAANPIEIGSYFTTGSGSIALVDSLLLLEGSGQTLLVIDVSNPTAPESIGCYFNLEMGIIDMDAKDNLLYIADFGFGDYSHLRIIDISNPSNPNQIGICSDFTMAFAICVKYPYAYFSEVSGLAVVDISNPTNPQKINNNTQLFGYEIISSATTMFAACGRSGLLIIDISTPTIPQLVGNYYSLGNTDDIFIDEYAYTVNDCGLLIFDISEPEHPIKIGFWDVGDFDFAYCIYVVDTFAYVGYNYTGLSIINVADKTDPKLIGNCPIPGDPYDIFVSENLAYVCDSDWFFGNDGLRILDVSDPQNPHQIGFLPHPIPNRGFYSIFVRGSLAYAAAHDLYIINVANPYLPTIVARCRTDACAGGIDLQDSLAYIADGLMGQDCGLRIINVADTKNPFEIGYHYSWIASDCDLFDAFVYMACGSEGIKVFDISDPFNPQEAGYITMPAGARSIKYSSQYIYVANRWCGFQIFEFLGTGIEEEKKEIPQPTTMHLLQNPIRGNHIELLLNSGNGSSVELELYNQIGQRLKAYQFNGLKSGENRLRLDAKGLPAGIYFLKLNDKPVGKVVKVK